MIITNYNRCDDLCKAVESIKHQDYPAFETIVVDNASTDKSLWMLGSRFPDVKVISLSANTGMDGYSVGFGHARGEFVFQMDNDSLMPDGNVLSEVVTRFAMGPKNLAVVATRVEEYTGQPASIDKLRLSDKRLGPINTGGFHSGGVGFRRVFLDRVGYYNRDVFLYGSELFLQMKFLAAGYLIHYYPEILMLHRSSDTARFSSGFYYEVRNRYWFMRHFATPKERTRYLCWMIMHDAVYSLYKRNPFVWLKALKDGFGALPGSLQHPLYSSRPDFLRKLEEVGTTFNLRGLNRRLRSDGNQ